MRKTFNLAGHIASRVGLQLLPKLALFTLVTRGNSGLKRENDGNIKLLVTP